MQDSGSFCWALEIPRFPNSSTRSIATQLSCTGLQKHNINSLPNKINFTTQKALSRLILLTLGGLNYL